MAQLRYPFVDGEERAEREEDEGDDEGPEVALLTEAEGMPGRGPPSGPPAAEEQQRLVSGVGGRVERLGQHGRRPGESEAQELGRRDAEVGEERGDDSPAGAF